MRWPTPPSRAVDKQNWHRWFAWYGVHVNGDTVWLEIVERKGTYHPDSCGGGYSYEYRNVAALNTIPSHE
jgi:hypothetical protein